MSQEPSKKEVKKHVNPSKRLDQKDFYKVCNCFAADAEWYLKERPNKKAAAARLTEKSGIQVSPESIRNIQEVTGVTWEPRMKTGTGVRPNSKSHLLHPARCLALAFEELCHRIGEPLPEMLKPLLAHYRDRLSMKEALEQAGHSVEEEVPSNPSSDPGSTNGQSPHDVPPVPKIDLRPIERKDTLYHEGETVTLDTRSAVHTIKRLDRNDHRALLSNGEWVHVSRLKPALVKM